MKMRNTWVVVLVVASVVLAGINTFSEKNSWWFSAGPAYRSGMSIDYSGSSYVQEMALHGASGYSSDPSSVGDPNAYADRAYENGYVEIDEFTLGDGGTWYWGYIDPAQFNSGAGTLTFSQPGGSRVARKTLSDNPLDADEGVEGSGVRAEFGRKILSKGVFQLDAAGGVQGIWNIHNQVSASTYSEQLIRQSYTVIDTYDAGPAIPPAPYDGVFFGPLIPNIPATRGRSYSVGSSWVAENQIDIETDADLETLWFGARAVWQGNGPLSLFLEPFVSCNYLDLSAKRTETFSAVYPDGTSQTLDQWRDEESIGQWLFGVGVSVGGRVDLNEDWFIDASLAMDQTEKADMDVGPNTVEVDPSGYSVSVQVGRSF